MIYKNKIDGKLVNYTQKYLQEVSQNIYDNLVFLRAISSIYLFSITYHIHNKHNIHEEEISKRIMEAIYQIQRVFLFLFFNIFNKIIDLYTYISIKSQKNLHLEGTAQYQL